MQSNFCKNNMNLAVERSFNAWIAFREINETFMKRNSFECMSTKMCKWALCPWFHYNKTNLSIWRVKKLHKLVSKQLLTRCILKLNCYIFSKFFFTWFSRTRTRVDTNCVHNATVVGYKIWNKNPLGISKKGAYIFFQMKSLIYLIESFIWFELKRRNFHASKINLNKPLLSLSYKLWIYLEHHRICRLKQL